MTQAKAPWTRGDVDLADDPIPPDQVVSGEPRARSKTWAQSADGSSCNWVWDCTSGAFRWWFSMDETVHIVEGSVSVQVDGEEAMVLNVGDAAYFPAGAWSTWTVDQYVRKHAVMRLPVPGPLAQLANGVSRRKHRAPSS